MNTEYIVMFATNYVLKDIEKLILNQEHTNNFFKRQ